MNRFVIFSIALGMACILSSCGTGDHYHRAEPQGKAVSIDAEHAQDSGEGRVILKKY